MSENEPVVLWEDRGAVAVVTINRPKALNALTAEVMDTLTTLFQTKGQREGLRAIIVTGAGKAFVAGADIPSMQAFTAADAEQFARKGHLLGLAIESLPVPVIAAVNGFALGGGCELAMACDIVIAAPKAQFGQPEVNLGVIPGFGGTQRLVRRAGLAVAMDLCLTGRFIGAEEALRIGIISRIAEDVMAEATQIAEAIAKKGPFAVRMARRAIHENAEADLDTGLSAERSLFALCFTTADQREGMRAFLERREPSWTGR